jgi:hypothetical protein
MSLIGQITGLRPSKSGIPKLTIQIAVENQFDANIAVLAVNTEVRASASPDSYDAWGSSQFLGYAVWECWSTQIAKSGKTTWELALPLSHYQIQKIEDARNGRDVSLMIRCSFTAAVIPDTGTTNYGAFISSNLSDPSRSAGNCVHKIARSDWLKLRKELGYGECLLIEIPLRTPARKGMAKALEHLDAASDHFAEDRPDETLASCYKAFEYLAQKAGFENPDQNAFEKLLVAVEDDSKKQKLKILMRDVCQFFNLGRHEPGKEKVVVDRRDAEYALFLSRATLAYLAKHWLESSPC